MKPTKPGTKTPRKAPARVTSLRDGHEDQLALWTLRALLCTEAWRHLVGEGMADEGLLDLLGAPRLRSDLVTPSRARKALERRLEELEAERAPRDGVLFRNVALLGDLLGLAPAEREVLAFAVLLGTQKCLQVCFERLEGLSARRLRSLLAETLALRDEDVQRALKKSGALATTGLVRVATEIRRSWDDPLVLMDGLDAVLLSEHESADALLANFFQRARPTALAVDDFPHAREDVELLLRFLRAVLKRDTAGVNVLVYGPPGTGKTELARLLARELVAELYEVNVEDQDGSAISSEGRFSAYLLCQKLLGRRPRSLVLFDEIEDVFPYAWHPLLGRQQRSGDDKGWTNRLLEGNTVPTLWLSNEVSQIDPAFLRRFDYILELRTPPESVRRRILEKHVEGLAARPEWVRKMATHEGLTPAHIERAVRVARLAAHDAALDAPGDAEKAIERVLRNNLAVLGHERTAGRYTGHTVAYDLAYLNASHDLARLVEGLARKPAGAICLYGPPGTGKTAFAYHLAERLGRPLLARRASDLLGMYVGQTEAQLAEMFREARAEQAVLLLDEADSFLQDRLGARHTWEVTQVNELLVQMESFDGLFLCATNLFDQLDAASLRRFTLKVRFDYLRPAQRLALFQRTLEDLGGALDPARLGDVRAALDRLDNLTPGEFATVRRQCQLLESTLDAGELLRALEEECRAKPGARRAPLGFGG